MNLHTEEYRPISWAEERASISRAMSDVLKAACILTHKHTGSSNWRQHWPSKVCCSLTLSVNYRRGGFNQIAFAAWASPLSPGEPREGPAPGEMCSPCFCLSSFLSFTPSESKFLPLNYRVSKLLATATQNIVIFILLSARLS